MDSGTTEPVVILQLIRALPLFGPYLHYNTSVNTLPLFPASDTYRERNWKTTNPSERDPNW